jgi:hypothetical protein
VVVQVVLKALCGGAGGAEGTEREFHLTVAFSLQHVFLVTSPGAIDDRHGICFGGSDVFGGHHS